MKLTFLLPVLIVAFLVFPDFK